MNKIENAKKTLWYYFKTIAEGADITLDSDCRADIEGIVEDIVKGIKEEQVDGLEMKNNKMKWVSVDERLPIDYETVFVYIKSTSIQSDEKHSVGCIKNGCWFIQNSEAMMGFPNLQYEVTHWMPLSSPAIIAKKAFCSRLQRKDDKNGTINNNQR